MAERTRAPVEDRFWKKIDKNGPIPEKQPDLGPCWQWTGWCSAGGYGRFWVHDRSVLVHRWAYSHFISPIPDGWNIDHLCVNPGCVNPRHLDALPTIRENVLRSELSLPAVNARKIHCPKGHPFDEANTAISGGRRYCRTCSRDRQQTPEQREYHRNYQRLWKLRRREARAAS
jgi:hypothetical protein